MKDVDHLGCGDCKFNGLNCKRIDNNLIQFYKPWFVSQPSRFHHICCDFQPIEWQKIICEEWTSFEDYWPAYVEQWLPYSNTNKLDYFFINGDKTVAYGVPMLDVVYGRMFDGDKLLAVEKMYYKQSKKNPIGYVLVHEPIDGVCVGGYNNDKQLRFL